MWLGVGIVNVNGDDWPAAERSEPASPVSKTSGGERGNEQRLIDAEIHDRFHRGVGSWGEPRNGWG